MPNNHFQSNLILGANLSPNVFTRVFELLQVATSSVVTLTYTAAQVLGGVFIRTQAGASNDTLPTATQLRDALVGGSGGMSPNIQIGTAFRLHIRHAGSVGAITVVAGTGGTISGTATIAVGSAKEFLIVFTAVGAVPTYTAYSLGTYVF